MKFCEVGYYKKIIILQILLFCSLNDESDAGGTIICFTGQIILWKCVIRYATFYVKSSITQYDYNYLFNCANNFFAKKECCRVQKTLKKK